MAYVIQREGLRDGEQPAVATLTAFSLSVAIALSGVKSPPLPSQRTGADRQFCAVVVVVADAAWYHERAQERENYLSPQLEPK